MIHARTWAVEFDLVVVAAGRERGQFGEVVGEPGRLVGQMDEAVLDRRRLGVEAHDLVAIRGIARHMRKARVDQVLDELRS